MALAAGDYFPNATLEYAKNSGAAAVTKGVLMKWDPTGDGYIITTADADETGPFAVCVKAAVSGDTRVLVATKGYVAVTADGIIEPNDLVQAASATAGQVIAWAANAIAATPL